MLVVAICTEMAAEALSRATDRWRYTSFPSSAPSSSGKPESDLGEDMWVLASPLNRYISIDRQWELLDSVHIALAFVVPALFFVLARRWLGTGPALLFVVVSLWIARLAFRLAVTYPICLAYADLHGDSEYNGVAGNGVYLMFGWVEPLFSCLLLVGFRVAWRRFRRRPPSDAPANA